MPELGRLELRLHSLLSVSQLQPHLLALSFCQHFSKLLQAVAGLPYLLDLAANIAEQPRDLIAAVKSDKAAVVAHALVVGDEDVELESILRLEVAAVE